MKIFLDSVGCKLNQSEIDRFAREVLAAGHEVVFEPAAADVAIINTCSVTKSAASDSRGKSRSAARAGSGEVILTGCWASLEPEAARNLPRVTRVFDNQSKDGLIQNLLQASSVRAPGKKGFPGRVQGAVMRTRAFIKAQDGCDNRCTFCVTTLARGQSRSTPIEQILTQIEQALHEGRKEIVLTGVQLGAWGQDLRPRLHLTALIKAILDSTPVPRLRLSSLEPWNLHPGFFDLWRDERLCPHLHLPLQSGSVRVLQKMNRRTSPDAFRELVREARRSIPELAVTTDIIVGFPGEGEDEFRESLEFVREMNFAGGHVFRYSPRSGTRAATYPAKVPAAWTSERNALMREALAAGEARHRQAHLGSEVQVLWEGSGRPCPGGWLVSGWSGNHLRVYAISPSDRSNQIDRVRLCGIRDDGVTGQIITNDAATAR